MHAHSVREYLFRHRREAGLPASRGARYSQHVACDIRGCRRHGDLRAERDQVPYGEESVTNQSRSRSRDLERDRN